MKRAVRRDLNPGERPSDCLKATSKRTCIVSLRGDNLPFDERIFPVLSEILSLIYARVCQSSINPGLVLVAVNL